MTQENAALSDQTALIMLSGDVMAKDFPAWIMQYAQKLGLSCAVAPFSDGLRVTAKGPDVMLEALALGCSLGPASVMVDQMAFELSQAA